MRLWAHYLIVKLLLKWFLRGLVFFLPRCIWQKWMSRDLLRICRCEGKPLPRSSQVFFESFSSDSQNFLRVPSYSDETYLRGRQCQSFFPSRTRGQPPLDSESDQEDHIKGRNPRSHNRYLALRKGASDEQHPQWGGYYKRSKDNIFIHYGWWRFCDWTGFRGLEFSLEVWEKICRNSSQTLQSSPNSRGWQGRSSI